jgi:formamidopyrimidine-DNA glycosylase
MPELPEVETIARTLRPELEGRTVAEALVRDPSVTPLSPRALAALVRGRVVQGVSRRGKLLVLELAGGHTLAFHLRMTGRVYVAEALGLPAHPGPEDRRVRLVLALDNGRHLHFHDVRRFGTVHAFGPGGLEHWRFAATLGPEPLECGCQEFRSRFAGRKARIKSLLLDQTVLAGVGNIYADEALHRAGIRPTARAAALSPARLERLHRAVRDVLREAIEACGSSIRDYRDGQGNAGSFQNAFRAYGRAGRPCLRCGAAMRACKVAGRTSTWCPECQRD